MPALTPLAEATESLTALAELLDSPEILIPGLLPALDLFPGSGPPYPKDNTIIPAVVGLALNVASEDPLTLTALSEA